jgi:hypothetical protein
MLLLRASSRKEWKRRRAGGEVPAGGAAGMARAARSAGASSSAPPRALRRADQGREAEEEGGASGATPASAQAQRPGDPALVQIHTQAGPSERARGRPPRQPRADGATPPALLPPRILRRRGRRSRCGRGWWPWLELAGAPAEKKGKGCRCGK